MKNKPLPPEINHTGFFQYWQQLWGPLHRLVCSIYDEVQEFNQIFVLIIAF